MQNTYESFAAVAVFRKLYDQGKDIYDVLGMYIKEIIVSERMSEFTSVELTSRLNSINSFEIKDSVVKSTLKRLNIRREGGMYHVDYDFDMEPKLDIYATQRQQSQALLDNLIEYIENEKKETLSEEDKEEVEQQFYKYMINQDTMEKYSIWISKYIMNVKLNPYYLDTINQIKEGTLIYEGICYGGNISELGKWTSELNIYMEQEILFYIAGYNGEVHKELYGEMLNYISEINNKPPQRKKYIHLWYTDEVKEEVDLYFSTAENIIEKGQTIDPSKTAMLHILENAKTKSDVVEEKVRFYKLLKSKGIRQFSYDYYSEENQKYNIVKDNAVYEEHQTIVQDKDKEHVRRYTNKLNCIAILRKDQNVNLERVKHILLTANSAILKCAHSRSMCKKGEVPKATDVDFLIDRFWFKLNKGFGKGMTPKTVDIVSRAQMILSTLSNAKVSAIFEDIKKKYQDGEISKEETMELLIELKSYSKTPDEIVDAADGDEIAKLNDYDINLRLEEREREKQARKAEKKLISELQNKVNSLEKEKQKDKEQHQEEISKLRDAVERATQQLDIQEQRRLKRKKAVKIALWVIIGMMCLAALTGGLIALFRLDNSITGIISIIIGIIPGLIWLVRFVGKKIFGKK